MGPPGNEDRWLSSRIEGAETRYVTVRRGGSLARVRRFDDQVREFGPTDVRVVWRRENARATSTARSLWAFDREFRRAARIVGSQSFRGLPSPLSAEQGGLVIQQSRAGSIEIVLEPYGLVRDLLLSDPLQITVTAYALLGGVRRVIGRIRPLGQDVPEAEEERGRVTVDLPGPGQAHVSAPADADAHVMLPGGGEIHIGHDD